MGTNGNEGHKGYQAELAVAAKLTEMGALVATLPGYAPYDLLVDMGGRIKRVQVKCANYDLDRDRLRLPARNGRGRIYNDNTFDLYAVVLPEGSIIWLDKSETSGYITLTDEHLMQTEYPG